MAITEKENNIAVKERDMVEVYLMRIIARYFDNESVYSRDSIENIINEALQRYKQYLVTEKHQFIFSLNGKTGRIALDITSLEGEWAFEKNSAFNKDFGTSARTILEGNDPRLNDQRTPLQHKHEIMDIEGLEERLKALRPTYSTHVHKNKKILDMLKYTGTRAEFDLIIIEELKVSLTYYLENIKFYQREEQSIHKLLVETIETCYQMLIELQNIAQEAVDNMHNWLPEAERYTDMQAKSFIDSFMLKLKSYLNKDQLQKLKDYFSKVFILRQEGTVALMGGTPIVTHEERDVQTEQISVSGGDAMRDLFNNSAPIDKSNMANWIWDEANETIVETINTEGWTGYVSLNKFSDYEHRATLQSNNSDDDFISIILAYDDATQDSLQLVCRSCQDATSYRSDARSYAAIIYNFNFFKNYGHIELLRWEPGSSHSQGWMSNPEGFPVFIKRTGNTFRVWADCGVPTPFIPDAANNITPTTAPIFEVNMEDYDCLKNLCTRFTRYGYGCYSQPYSTYRDIWFKGTNIVPGESEYNSKVNMHEINVLPISGIAPTEIEQGYLKTHLVYEQDGKDVSIPLPICIQRDGHYVIVQARQENGILKVDVNVSNEFENTYGSELNIYDNKFIVVGTLRKPYYEWTNLCIIDTAEKFNKVKSILPFNEDFYIYGQCNFVMDTSEGTFYQDKNGNFVQVTDNIYIEWDNNEPLLKGSACGLLINKNFKTGMDRIYNYHMAVQELELKQLSDYFPNPRIHYQIFGTQEVT